MARQQCVQFSDALGLQALKRIRLGLQCIEFASDPLFCIWLWHRIIKHNRSLRHELTRSAS